ncbi:MAG: M3 family oligoendopeptidase, partial [Rhodobacteraceae bacterium]|nr:M3 family oligoendopeptidase [Paracoccaceae bacterium]
MSFTNFNSEKSHGKLDKVPLPHWDLGDLYEARDSKKLSKDIRFLDKVCEEFESKYQGKIEANKDAEFLYQSLQEFESIELRKNRIISYAYLLHQTNLNDPAIGKFFGDCDAKFKSWEAKLVFFENQLSQIPESTLKVMLENNADLERYGHYLASCQKFKPHVLPLEMEKYSKDNSILKSSWVRLFDATISSIKCQVGNKALTLEQTLAMLQSGKRKKRKRAFHALSNEFEERSAIFALITNTLVKGKEVEDNWRKFPSPQSSRHLNNEIEDKVVEALQESVVNSYPDISHRFYQLKSQLLGLKKMQYWDRVAPLPMAPQNKVPWEKAVETVEYAFSAFSPQFASLAKQFFDNPWIDVPVREGKSGGGFCHPTVADAHPYILLNYQNRTRDVMVLAHELGHGVHQFLAQDKGEILSRTSLTLAETASVFGEMLTFESLLEKATNPRERFALIAEKLDDMINTVIRQMSFYEFETRLHYQRREGELTPEDIGKIWLETQTDCLGPAFKFNEDYNSFWSYIPHFIHVPFYVYAYSF